VAKIFENNTLNWVGGIFVFVNALLSIYFLTGNFLLPLAVGGTVLSIVILLVLVAKKRFACCKRTHPSINYQYFCNIMYWLFHIYSIKANRSRQNKTTTGANRSRKNETTTGTSESRLRFTISIGRGSKKTLTKSWYSATNWININRTFATLVV